MASLPPPSQGFSRRDQYASPPPNVVASPAVGVQGLYWINCDLCTTYGNSYLDLISHRNLLCRCLLPQCFFASLLFFAGLMRLVGMVLVGPFVSLCHQLVGYDLAITGKLFELPALTWPMQALTYVTLLRFGTYRGNDCKVVL